MIDKFIDFVDRNPRFLFGMAVAAFVILALVVRYNLYWK